MSTFSLALSSRHRDGIVAAARATHPEECCGILLGRRKPEGETRVVRVMGASNVSALDRRRSFEIDPARLLQAVDRARVLGLAVVGFYHSHPDGAQRPSERDRRAAWSDMSYLIVPHDGTMTSWRRGCHGGFTAEVVTEKPESEIMPGVRRE